MRSLSLVRMPCFRRCSMISTTSPNHEGVEGTECEEVWMMTEESAILVMCTSLLGKMCILPQERHILCLLATNYISLRNSWELGHLAEAAARTVSQGARYPVVVLADG